ncbi:MAG: Type 1 glutamine amidotransferase-like domain-containing protein [Eubacteriales bacterium]|nr:Type 1 glutamine amidotransferase-like domain-containing protein [Eubacteriales bacterium]
MKLYLSSYKLGNSTDALKEWISENGNRMALIPNARDAYPDGAQKERGIGDDVQALQEVGFAVTVVSLTDYFGKAQRMRADLKEFRAFFAIGGNTFVLRQAMRQSGFDTYLKELSVLKPYLYGGYSAGICLLAPHMQGLELVDDPTANPYGCAPIYAGLGLIEYLPVPHYQSDHPESQAVNDVVAFLRGNGVKHVTLRDGDVIVADTCRAP